MKCEDRQSDTGFALCIHSVT